MAVLREIVEQEIGDDRADVEAHRPHEGEFRIDDARVLRRQHDGAGVQVAMQHGFGGGEELELEARDGDLQVAILAPARGIGIELRRGPAVELRHAVGIGEDQVLGDLAQRGVAGEGGDHRLLPVRRQRKVGGEVERARHEGRDVVGEFRIDGRRDHAAPHDDVRLEQLHHDQRLASRHNAGSPAPAGPSAAPARTAPCAHNARATAAAASFRPRAAHRAAPASRRRRPAGP